LFADTQRVMAAIGADDWLSRHFVFTGLSSAGVSPRTGVRDCRALVAFATGRDSFDDWRGAAFRFKPERKIAAGGGLTAVHDTPKLEKLSACRGSSLVERRPEKAGVASSILAPGTRFFSYLQPIADLAFGTPFEVSCHERRRTGARA